MNQKYQARKRRKMRKSVFGGALLFVLLFFPVLMGKAAGEEKELLLEYQAYEERFASIEGMEDLEENQYEIMEDQIFPVTLETIRQEELTLVPAIDRSLNRAALFFLDGAGQVVYRFNQLEANYRLKGELKQAVKDVIGVSFSDVNQDGLKDIILISRCENPSGSYAGIPYKVLPCRSPA